MSVLLLLLLRLFCHRKLNLWKLLSEKAYCVCLHGCSKGCLDSWWSGGLLGFAYKYREILALAALGQTRVKWSHWLGLPSKSWFSLWRRAKLSLGTYQTHRHYTLIIYQSGAVCWRQAAQHELVRTFPNPPLAFVFVERKEKFNITPGVVISEICRLFMLFYKLTFFFILICFYLVAKRHNSSCVTSSLSI